MHEMSLACSVLQIVETASIKDAFHRVRTLRLSVPALAGVEIEALRFALDSVKRDTVLAGAELIIDEPPSTAHCLDCDARIEIRDFDDVCPLCRKHRWQLLDDRGLRVVDLLVE